MFFDMEKFMKDYFANIFSVELNDVGAYLVYAPRH